MKVKLRILKLVVSARWTGAVKTKGVILVFQIKKSIPFNHTKPPHPGLLVQVGKS
jgi:hypothetical protein